jgi:hypothetical protein
MKSLIAAKRKKAPPKKKLKKNRDISPIKLSKEKEKEKKAEEVEQPIEKEKEIDIPGEDQELLKRLVGLQAIASDLRAVGAVVLANRVLAKSEGRRRFFKEGESGKEEFIKHLKVLKKEGLGKVDIIKLLMKFVSRTI